MRTVERWIQDCARRWKQQHCGWSGAQVCDAARPETLTNAENLQSGEGLGVVKKLVEAYDPEGGYASCRTSGQRLDVEFDMTDILNSLGKWENLIKQHDAIVDELEGVQERVNIATLMRRMGKVHALRTTQERTLSSTCLRRKTSGARMEFGMVKGSQHGKRQHQQNKGGANGTGSHHRQNVRTLRETWSCEGGLLVRQKRSTIVWSLEPPQLLFFSGQACCCTLGLKLACSATHARVLCLCPHLPNTICTTDA